jgi:hypothetical protein
MESALWWHKSLKRRMKVKDLNLDFVPPDLEFVPPGLDFVPKKFGYRSGGFGFPSSRWRSSRSIARAIPSETEAAADPPSAPMRVALEARAGQ